MPDPVPRTPRAEQTRRAIVDAAMRLFRDHGYAKTTMRAVAGEAGVSLGNAYYYFASKEHLVQAFYDQVQTEHAAVVEELLRRESGFARRLAGVMAAWIDVAEPSHEFAGQFFKVAADPSSPLSPFSPESTPARRASIAIYERVVQGSDLKVSAALREELPELLWLAQMGVVLFWVHDTSPGRVRTRQLVDGVVPLIERLVRLTRVPGVRGAVDDLLSLVERLRS